MVDGHLQVHSVGPLGVIEKPANVMLTVVKRDVWHCAIPERDPPSDDSILNLRRHDCFRRDRHFDVRARGENRDTHVTVPPLAQHPFGHATLGIVMTAAELRVVAALLVAVIQVAENKELDARFNGQLIRTNRPIGFRLFAAVETINVDEGAPATREALPQVVLAGECSLNELDVAEIGQLSCTARIGIASQDSQAVGSVLCETAAHRQALGASGADDKDATTGHGVYG